MMGQSKESILKWMQMAHKQMTQGCGRDQCLNFQCARCPFGNRWSPNDAALHLTQLLNDCKVVPTSSLFLLCDVPSPDPSLEDLLSLPSEALIDLLSDPVILGSCFRSGLWSATSASLDWESLRKFRMLLEEQPGTLKEILNSLVFSPYKDLYLPRVVLMFLNHSELMDQSNHNALVNLCKHLTTRGLDQLKVWLGELDPGCLSSYILTCQQFITMNVVPLERMNNAQVQSLQSVINVLEAIYKSTEDNKRVDFSIFYNDAINKLPLEQEYTNWICSRRGFSFVNYPWILDTQSKSTFMRLESRDQLPHRMGNSHGMSITMLRVKRDNLIEDTLNAIGRGEINTKNILKVKFLGEDGVDEGGPVSYTHLTLPTNREV